MKILNNPSGALRINRTFYGQHADEFCHNTGNLEMADLQRPFLAELADGAHILDAGSGSGRDSATFQRMGYKVTAIDGSPEMVKATRSLGVNAKVLAFQDMMFEEKFDGIWSCASLLHVPHVEISNVIHRLIRALRFEGVIFIAIKEGEGEGLAPDGRFFSYFSRKQFSDLLSAEPEIKILKSWRTADKVSPSARAWLNFLARRTPAK